MSFYQDNDGNGYMRMRGNSAWENFYIQTNNGSTTNTAFHIDTSRAVHLKYQNNTKLSTKSDGVDITGELQCDSLDVDGTADLTGSVQSGDRFRAKNSNGGIYFGDTTGGFGDACAIARAQVAGYHSSGSEVGDLVIGGQRQKNILFGTSTSSSGGLTTRCKVTAAGHFVPHSDNSYDLGSTSNRWRNLYTNDLHLSNESRKDTGGNDVDGTWGDWTLQEGEDKIFMINNRTGKRYSIIMKEEN
jgi:hypothetical protein